MIDKLSPSERLRKFLNEPEPIEFDNTVKNDCEFFYGGDGLSEDNPVSINCVCIEEARSSMDIFIRNNCGVDCKRTGREYTIGYHEGSRKTIKVIQVKKSDKTNMEFFFDISRQVKDPINSGKTTINGDKPF